MRTLALPASRMILLASVAALAMTAPTACAEVPSVDAYAGQALVLGRPHRLQRGTYGGSEGAPATAGSLASPAHGSATGVGAAAGGNPAGRGQSDYSKGSNRGGTSSVGTAGRAAQGARGSSRAPESVRSSAVLSGLDVLWLLVGFVCLLGTGMVVRRVARRAD